MVMIKNEACFCYHYSLLDFPLLKYHTLEIQEIRQLLSGRWKLERKSTRKSYGESQRPPQSNATQHLRWACKNTYIIIITSIINLPQASKNETWSSVQVLLMKQSCLDRFRRNFKATSWNFSFKPRPKSIQSFVRGRSMKLSCFTGSPDSFPFIYSRQQVGLEILFPA